MGGGAEGPTDGTQRGDAEPKRNRDSTVVTIAQVTDTSDGGHPTTRIVKPYWWTGLPLHDQCDRLIHLLRETWRRRQVVVDASRLGADLASRLLRASGSTVVEPHAFTMATKSRLAYLLLAHVPRGRLQMWTENVTYPSPEATEFWSQVTNVRPVLRPGNQPGFAAPSTSGHDDFVTALALLSWASRNVPPDPVQALIRTEQLTQPRIRRPPYSSRDRRF